MDLDLKASKLEKDQKSRKEDILRRREKADAEERARQQRVNGGVAPLGAARGLSSPPSVGRGAASKHSFATATPAEDSLRGGSISSNSNSNSINNATNTNSNSNSDSNIHNNSNSTSSVDNNKPEPDPNVPIVKNEVVWYIKESESAPMEALVLGVHKDDFPNIYYTIKLSNGREKQTDAKYIRRK